MLRWSRAITILTLCVLVPTTLSGQAELADQGTPIFNRVELGQQVLSDYAVAIAAKRERCDFRKSSETLMVWERTPKGYVPDRYLDAKGQRTAATEWLRNELSRVGPFPKTYQLHWAVPSGNWSWDAEKELLTIGWKVTDLPKTPSTTRDSLFPDFEGSEVPGNNGAKAWAYTLGTSLYVFYEMPVTRDVARELRLLTTTNPLVLEAILHVRGDGFPPRIAGMERAFGPREYWGCETLVGVMEPGAWRARLGQRQLGSGPAAGRTRP